MTTKADFNAEEWQQVVEGPALGGLLVAMAQRGGCCARAWRWRRPTARRASSMPKASCWARSSVSRRWSKRAFEARGAAQRGPGRIGGAVALVESKAGPEDAEAYPLLDHGRRARRRADQVRRGARDRRRAGERGRGPQHWTRCRGAGRPSGSASA